MKVRIRMAEENNRIHQIIANLSSAASVAVDGVNDAVQNAGNVVTGKYDGIRMNMELNRLQDEQEGLFADIGRIMFKLQGGKAAGMEDDATQMVDAQQEVDRLLLLADQKQQEIDLCAARIFRNSGNVVCAGCGKVSAGKDTYCPSCGTKLPKQN